MPAAITIHNIDDEVYAALRDRAAQAKQSLNRTIKELMRVGLGLPTAEERERIEAWKKLCGSISKEDGEEWLKTLEPFEQIEPEMWK